jgi:hypothetical protein
MKDIRIPGVAWVIAIVEPWMIDLAITLLISGLKTANVGTEQLNNALDVIEQLLNDKATAFVAPSEGVRAAASVAPVEVEKIPPRPNKTVRWLVG